MVISSDAEKLPHKNVSLLMLMDHYQSSLLNSEQSKFRTDLNLIKVINVMLKNRKILLLKCDKVTPPHHLDMP